MSQNKYYFDTDITIGWVRSGATCARIETLSELFIEWFLCEPYETSNVQLFLHNNHLDRILSESDFFGLVCGHTYLSGDLILLISMILPFRITRNKTKRLNDMARVSGARLLHTDSSIVHDRIKEIMYQHKINKQEQYRNHYKVRKHEYYIANKEHFNQLARQYAQEHASEIAEYQHKYRQEHHSAMLAYEAEYRKTNAAAVSARKKKCYQAKKDEYQSKHKTYYEKHRQEIAAQQHAKHEKDKQRDEKALSVCRTYVYFLQMRHNNRAAYLKLFGQRNLVSNSIKECTALQTMDKTKCVFCNGTTNPNESCPMLHISDMSPEHIAAIEQIAIKQKTR